MRKNLSLSIVTLAVALAACTAEKPAPRPAPTETGDAAPAVEPATATPADGPAGEVPAGTREPSDAAPAKASLPEGVDATWALYYEHGIAYEFGSEAGLAKAAETGKPMMMFYTATW